MPPIHLLLVDDQDLYRQQLADVLADYSGFQVLGQARDGLEAIEKAHALQPDLILMDMNMPRCDGLEATRRIKQELPNIAICILTTQPQDSRVSQALICGAQGCLGKNVSVDKMLETLHSLVGNQAAPGTLTGPDQQAQNRLEFGHRCDNWQ